MIDVKSLKLLVGQIAEEHGISEDKIIESIEQSLAAAYKKEYGTRSQMVRAKLDMKTGKTRFWQVKLVVDKDQLYTEEELEEMKEAKEAGREMEEVSEEERKIRFTEERHVMLTDAPKGSKAGDEIETELPVKEDFGRIAAQTAKQVILQKIREAERDSIMTEFKDKEGELVSGIVQRVEGNVLFVDLGKTLGIMPREEQVPGEFYRTGQRLKFYVLRVEESNRGPTIVLSRAYPKFISKLFELEVPEIQAESVHIKGIAREPGSRSKIAVESTESGVDPVGSMVGQRGTRVSAVINELGGEKIDIIEWSDDSEEFIANALSPAKVQEVKLLGDNRAEADVPEDQLSLAIGREGQNVRLAAKLTGWKIDIRTPEGEKVEMEETEEPKSQKAEEQEPEEQGKTDEA